LRLTIIERLARGELPEMEQAGLPPEAHPELIKRLAEETANEHQRKRCAASSRVISPRSANSPSRKTSISW
jgi:hypothetical protein